MPATDEVWRLQRGSDADCLFFQRMVNGGQPITDKGTRQGIWIGTAGGVLLSHINSLNADKVLKTMEEGWSAWQGLSDEDKHLAEGIDLRPRHRWEDSKPVGGLALERVARDVSAQHGLALGGQEGRPRSAWNFDTVWFSAEEARAWLSARPTLGEVHALPTISAQRLARFHLVDNVRGQTLPFAEEEILEAQFETEVTGLEGSRVEIEIRGTTNAESADQWLLGENLWKPKQYPPHGIQTHALGRARFDLKRNAFVDFELVALGQRRGRAGVNGRARDSSPGLIGFDFSLAPDKPVIAPTFIALYNAAWVDFDGSETKNF